MGFGTDNKKHKFVVKPKTHFSMNPHRFMALLLFSFLFSLPSQSQFFNVKQSPLYSSAEGVLLAEESPTATTSEAGYTTSVGIRGGFTSGISLKHFITSTAALEGIVGTRFNGLSITGLYEIHKANALQVPNLTWEYGIGGRLGYYYGRNYYRGRPHGWDGRYLTAVGVVGIIGLEYRLDEIPFTVSLDLMPNIYLNHWDYGFRNFIDASFSLRYILK